MLVTSRGKKLRFPSCLCQQVFIGKDRVVVVAGDFGLDFMEFFVFILPFQRKDKCTNPTVNYSEFCLCFYWRSECCSSELFLRMPPLAHFETLLAFLACKLIYVTGILEKSSRVYLNGK